MGEEVEIDALGLLGAYQEDDEEEDDHEREIRDQILEMDEEEDGRDRVCQDETEAEVPDTDILRAQVASLEEQMRVLMVERDAYRVERARALIERDQAVARRQETEQRFTELRTLCTGPSATFARELVRAGERERYYRDLYEAEVPLERWAPSFSAAQSSRSQTRTHTQTVSTEGVDQPRRAGPYDRPPTALRSTGSQHQSPTHS